jgi:uroporphyrinogen-III synthase
MPARRPKQPLSSLGADKILFASPSAVAGFVNQIDVDAAIGVFTIGPSTSAAARSHGFGVTAEAREPSLAGLLEAMHGDT